MDEPFQHRFGRIVIEPARRRLLVDDEPAKIGARAFDLLMALFERRDRVVSKDELLDLVWPNVTVEEGNLQVQIATLRRLLGAQAIATVPGRGYQFVAPDAPPRSAHERPALAAQPLDADGGGAVPPRTARLVQRGVAIVEPRRGGRRCARRRGRLGSVRALWRRLPASRASPRCLSST